mgnify:CR=1 FL=1
MAELMTLLGGGNDDLYNEIIKENLENRTLVFNEDVNDSLIESYILYILKWNREDRDIEPSKRRKITIILNSPGGDCMIGFGGMVNCIEQSKTPIRVVGIGLVASMAFHIYITCKERFAFKDTILLMHDGEQSAASSGGKFKDIARFFENMDNRTKQHVLKYTSMTEEFYDEHQDREYYVYADDAKALGCVDYIIGVDCDIDAII